MRVGITGATGFIGSYLSRRMLANRDHDVRVLVRRPAPQVTFEGAAVVRGDLSSPQDCEKFAAGLDVIYHLAQTNSPVNSDQDQAADALANQIPLLNLLAAVQRLETKPHIVYFSSGGAVYAPK